MSSTAAGAAAIRPAGAPDLGAIRELLTLRDGHPWDDASTSWFVRELDPERCRAWLAVDGARPAAFTNLFLRDLVGPAGALRAGYWANLFVDPDYRGQLLYPRLPLAMLSGARALHLDLVYTSVRLRDVSHANTRIGFTKVGTWNVLIKSLRPARLVGKFRGWAPVVTLATPIDALYGSMLHVLRRRPAPGLALEEVDLAGPTVDALVELLRAQARDRIVESLTPDQFRYRYRQTRENTRYVVLAVRRGGALVGGLTYRLAERGRGIRAGVVMDAISAPGEEEALTLALEHAERDAHRSGCELMLFLSGLGAEIDRFFRRHHYHGGPELYDLLVWPKQKLTESRALGALSSWRFGFVDHDAF